MSNESPETSEMLGRLTVARTLRKGRAEIQQPLTKMSTNTKRECPHCHGRLERYEDPKAVAIIADLETKLAEVAAFTKHVGAATFAEARDVLFRSCSQYQDTIAEQFDKIKAIAKERDEARIALSAASGIFDQITQSLTKERDEALAELNAWNEALEKHGQRVIEIPPGGGGGFSSSPTASPGYMAPVMRRTLFGKTVIEVTEWHSDKGFNDMIALVKKAMSRGEKVIELRHAT